VTFCKTWVDVARRTPEGIISPKRRGSDVHRSAARTVWYMAQAINVNLSYKEHRAFEAFLISCLKKEIVYEIGYRDSYHGKQYGSVLNLWYGGPPGPKLRQFRKDVEIFYPGLFAVDQFRTYEDNGISRSNNCLMWMSRR